MTTSAKSNAVPGATSERLNEVWFRPHPPYREVR